MSIIIKAGSDICKANTNTSTAKFQYSFSKATRFPIPHLADEIRKKKIQALIDKGEDIKQPPIGQYTIYKLPSTLSNRRTTFGKGNKYDFTKTSNFCKILCYNPYSDFDQKNPHGPKYSFTKGPRSGKSEIVKKKKEGEENEEKKDGDKKELHDTNGPSPAAYNYLKKFGWDAPKYSMKGRHGTPVKKKQKEGEEPTKKEEEKPYMTKVTIQIRDTGKYVVSQIPNVNSIKMDKDKSRRTKYDTNKNPAPGDYKLHQLLGRVNESQYRSYEPISIAGRHPVKDSRTNYPGPGSYPIPSDFGQYLSKDADKYPKENVYVVEKPKFEEKAWRHNMKKIEPKEEIAEEDYNNNDNNNNEEEPSPDDNKGETPGENNDNVTPDDNKVEQNEEPKQEEKKEEPKQEEKKEETKEEDKKSELMLLKDMLVYQEGEDKGNEQTPGNEA
jgi:hypothetical protein